MMRLVYCRVGPQVRTRSVTMTRKVRVLERATSGAIAVVEGRLTQVVGGLTQNVNVRLRRGEESGEQRDRGDARREPQHEVDR